MSNNEKNQEIAASKAGMDPKRARKYLAANRLPSELVKERQWRMREDPFLEVWEQVRQQMEESPVLRGGDVDESPHCYKRLPEVLTEHADSVRILHTLKPLGVVMAGKDVYDPFKD